MHNVASIIKGHNRRITARSNTSNATVQKTCNCRRKDSCPLKGDCLCSGVVYRAEVTREDNSVKHAYTSLTENTFKQRFYQHTQSFRNSKYRHSTELSNKIWQLKDQDIDYTLEWSIMQSAAAYSNASKLCHLCLAEKLHIIQNMKHPACINKRTELISKCRHRNKFLLCNFKGVT
jgi:hypothetical protein